MDKQTKRDKEIKRKWERQRYRENVPPFFVYTYFLLCRSMRNIERVRKKVCVCVCVCQRERDRVLLEDVYV